MGGGFEPPKPPSGYATGGRGNLYAQFITLPLMTAYRVQHIGF